MASRTAFKRLITTLWVSVFLQFVLTVATLGVTASAAQGFRQNLDYPRIPGKLAYNIAAAVITLLVLIIVIPLELLEYPFWTDLNARWHSWPRVSILGMLSAFWIGGVASSDYNCGDLCSPRTSTGGFVKYAGICCSCADYRRFDCSKVSVAHPSYTEPTEHRYQATKALDAMLMILFLFSTVLLISMHWVKRYTVPAPAANDLAEEQVSEPPPRYSKGTAGATVK